MAATVVPFSSSPTSASDRSTVSVVLQCIAMIVVATLATAAPANWAMIAEPLGAQSSEWVHGFARLVVAVIAIAILHRRGWSELAGVTSFRPRLGTGGRRRLSLTIAALLAVATLLPATGMLTTEWGAVEAIASYVWYFGMTGPFEELVFRGLVFVTLAVHWSERPGGLRLAAVVGAVLFGIAHINPIAIVLTGTVAFALTGLMIAARSIWPAVLAHSAYDIFAQFPMDDAGVPTEGWQLPTAFGFYVLAAIATWRLLGREDSLEAAMRLRDSRVRTPNAVEPMEANRETR